MFCYLKEYILMLFCIERPNVRKQQSVILLLCWYFFSFCGRKSGKMNEWTLVDPLFVCSGALCPSQKKFSYVVKFLSFLGKTSTKQRIKFLPQGHNTVSLVSLEPATLHFQV